MKSSRERSVPGAIPVRFWKSNRLETVTLPVRTRLVFAIAFRLRMSVWLDEGSSAAATSFFVSDGSPDEDIAIGGLVISSTMSEAGIGVRLRVASSDTACRTRSDCEKRNFAEECESNLSSLSESLLATLNHINSQPNTLPWEVEDSDLLLVSYLGTTITQRLFVSLTPFNAVGHVASFALSAASEGQNSSLFLANLAEPVINVPTVLMEWLKRMIQEYYVEDGKKISIAVVVNIMDVFIFKQTISLLGAENETETIVTKWEKEGEKQEQEGSKTFHFVSDEDEEEEEEVKYVEEPFRVTMIAHSVVTGGEFKLRDLLDPHPLPPRPPAAEYDIITFVVVGDANVIPKRVIRQLRKKRGVKMERKAMGEQNGWENGDEVEMVDFGCLRDLRRRKKRTVQSTHTTEETSMINPFPLSPDNSLPDFHRPSLHKQPSSTAVLPQQFANAMSMPFPLFVARSESTLPLACQLESSPPLPFSTREHLSRFNSISSPHLSFYTHTLPQLSSSPLNGSSVVESEDMGNKSGMTQLDVNAFTLLSPHKQSYPSLHTLTQSSVQSEPKVAQRRKLMEKEAESEREMEEKGIVRDALADEMWTKNLEESIETIGENIKTFKTELFPSLCVLAVLMMVLLTALLVLGALFVPLTLPTLTKRQGSLMIWTNTMLQFYQSTLFLLQLTTRSVETQVDMEEPKNPDVMSSSVYTHVMNGSSERTDWESYWKLHADLSRANPKIDQRALSFVSDNGVGVNSCVLEDGTQCPRDRYASDFGGEGLSGIVGR
ncbi:hypothetical protein BLNAU_20990 [Blattamonas nauphoetae]|uniref:Transmembrane protein n=1 Tax=Blattamonas nauphoetae TaxID=2049346 RepID=A0ABQ9WX55_9EUKA|nr:hypothetical protein BLNAU_20990 [Blattamonas nauphoetae]